MPSVYAHYRFGAQLLKTLPPDVRRTVNRYRRLYDVGLHGPDIFFYYNPAAKNGLSTLAAKFHRQSGRDFFTRVCKRHRLEPSEPARAYLYGLLAHYCLDSLCHPLIHAHTDEGPLDHTELETAFDRYLLEKDGKRPPHTQDLSPHIRLSDSECATVSGFYPPVTAAQVSRSVRSMAFCTKALAFPQSAARRVVAAVLTVSGGTHSHKLMPEDANPRCAHLVPELDALYARAFRLYPTLLRQITANLTCSVPLGEEFTPNFG